MSATPTHDNIPLSGFPNIDGLVQGSSWTDTGTVTLTYSFAYDPLGGAFPWSPQEKALMTQALESWTNVANINVTELPDIAPGANYPGAVSDLVFIAAGYSGLTGLLGIGYFPDPDFADQDFASGTLGALGYTRANYPQPEGDIFLFDDDPYFPTVKLGAIGFETVVHELGHTLGMKHPHDDGGNFRPLLNPLYDSQFYTVMSYNDIQSVLNPGNPEVLYKGFVTTPMPLDIVAIQSIYGVNYSAHTGNDTYFLKQDGQVKTIWDAGGIDTIDASGLPGGNTPLTQLVINLHGTDPNNPDYLQYINEGDGFSFVAMSCYVQDVSKTFVVNYIENALGTGSNDLLIGNETDNTLNGAGGADTMVGDIGNDTFFIDNIGDSVSENIGEGNDTIISTLTIDLSALTAEIENLTLTGGLKINATGTTADNILIGNSATNTIIGDLGDDTLNGGAGIDTLIGGDGNDTYVVDNAKDVVTENPGEGTDTVFSSVKYTLSADLENLTLTGIGGNAGTGNASDNIIIGNKGNNALFGLDGNDTLDGGAGNDTLDGGTGADTMTGGFGDDTFIVDNPLDVLNESLGEGKDLVKASASVSIAGPAAAGIENITLTGVGNIDATGNAQNNVITGNAGNNILDGGAGADKLTGGAGNDTYIIDNQADTISDSGGIDTVVTDIAYTFGKAGFLSVGLENLTLTGALNIDAIGNSAVNTIIGNAGENILDGGQASDTLTGGGGSDTFRFSAAPAQGGIDIVTDFTGGAGGDVIDVTDILQGYIAGATVSDFVHTTDVGADTVLSVDVNGLASGANFVQIGTLLGVNLGSNVAALFASGNLVLHRDEVLAGTAGVDNKSGGIGNDTLTGLGGNDILDGGSGNDTLDGGTGGDDMTGGRGDDVFIVDNVGDIVRENANEGTDLVKSSVSFSAAAAPSDGVENITLTGTGNIDATGNALVNTLTGNSGNNSLDGGTGADKLSGGAGNDTYVVDDQGDVIDDTSGTDTVLTDISYSFGGTGKMSAAIENLIFTGGADTSVTGSTLANTIAGNTGANTIDGAEGDDTLLGNDGNDTLTGGDGNDRLFGGNNDDVLIGSAGTDTLTGDAGIDTFRFVPGSGIDTVTDFAVGIGGDIVDVADMIHVYNGNIADYVQLSFVVGNTIVKVDADGLANGSSYTQVAVLTGVNLGISAAIAEANGNLIVFRNDVVTGGPNSDVLKGDFGDDTLVGGAGNDTLIGGLGDDDMSGGLGNDTYYVDSSADIVRENPGEGTDLVRATATFDIGVPASVGVENITLIGGNLDAFGNALANTLIGTDGDNSLDGRAGADKLVGGAGNDTYVIDDQGDVITDTDGIDTVRTDITYLFGAKGVMANFIENLVMTGAFDINAIGNTLGNTITGNDGNNSIDGGAGNDVLYGDDPISLGGGNDVLYGNTGNDTLQGGNGNDTYIIDSNGDTIIEFAGVGTGTDLVKSSITFSLAALANVENLTLTGTGNISGTGNGAVNVITGNTGINTLDGGAGDDTLNGGGGLDILIGNGGNDTYIIDNAIGSIDELPGGGTDIVLSSITFSIAPYAEVENLTLTGTADINGTGNINVNTITGNDGVNTLDGGAADDTLIGADGNDTYIVDSSTDVVTELAGEGTADIVMSSADYDLSTYLEVENLTLTGTALIGTGNVNSNIITGNASDNTLDGGGGGTDILSGGAGLDTLTTGGGDDSLDGGSGVDTMDGGLGNDHYVVDNALDVVIDGGGTDLISSSITFSLSGLTVENLTLTGSSAINGTGNAGDNTITGNNGANSLDGGGGGNDALFGGSGADTLVSAGGDDTLNGGTGIDSMDGGGGNDLYFVDNAGDVVTELPGGGTDTVSSSITFSLASLDDFENLILTGSGAISGTGNAGDNTITGNSGANTLDAGGSGFDTLSGGGGADRLIGGADDDVLDGGLGLDTMTGGTGRDTFMFSTAPATSNADTITDFDNGVAGDVLNVHNILSGVYSGTITDYVQITQSGADSLVKFDADGLANGSNFVLIATLKSVNVGTDEAAFLAAGHLTI